MKNVVYQKHELQAFLCSPIFGSKDIEMLLALRARTEDLINHQISFEDIFSTDIIKHVIWSC